MHGFHDPRVDAEHDRIIQAFEALWERQDRGRFELAEAQALGACLLRYLGRHCRREETLMCAHGYPGAAAHARAHQELQRSFRRHLRTALTDPARFPAALGLVRTLILGHLVTWDDAYGAWLESRVLGAA